MNRKFFKCVCLSLLSFLLLSCKEQSAETVLLQKREEKTKLSFMWWGSEARNEKYLKAIELFEEQNNSIDVEYEYMEWTDYWSHLASKTAAGELPDVIQMDAQYFAQYIEKKQLADLSSFLQKEIHSTAIKPSIIENGYLKQKLYGIPAGMNVMAMVINQTLTIQSTAQLDYSHYSFEDFIQHVSTVSRDTGAYGWMDVLDNSVLFQYYLRTKGEDFYRYREDGTPTIGFSKEHFVHFMQVISDLVKTRVMPNAEAVRNAKSFKENPFSLGKAAFLQVWSNQFVTYQESAESGIRFSLRLPYDSRSGALTLRPTFYYAITETSQVKNQAATFIDFLINDPEANKILGTERGIPVNEEAKKAIFEMMSDTEKETMKYVDDVVELAGEPSPIPPIGFAEVNDYFKEIYAEVTYGHLQPEEAYERFVRRTEEVFEKYYRITSNT